MHSNESSSFSTVKRRYFLYYNIAYVFNHCGTSLCEKMRNTQKQTAGSRLQQQKADSR
jgi:hypothetical protein